MKIERIFEEKLQDLVSKSGRIKKLKQIAKVFDNGNYLFVYRSQESNKKLWVETNYRKDPIIFENPVIEYDVETVVTAVEDKYYEMISSSLSFESLAYYMIGLKGE